MNRKSILLTEIILLTENCFQGSGEPLKYSTNGKYFIDKKLFQGICILFTESILLTDSILLTESCIQESGKSEKYSSNRIYTNDEKIIFGIPVNFLAEGKYCNGKLCSGIW